MTDPTAYAKILQQVGAYGFAVVVLAGICAAIMALIGVLLKKLASDFVPQKAYDRACDDGAKVADAVDTLKDAVSEQTGAINVLSTLLELTLKSGGGAR